MIVAASPSVLAQSPPDAVRHAQQLFDDARTLMRAERYSEACPKFAESQRLDPGGGTLLNLAICHEKEGRNATAWREFNDALAQAQKDARADREKTASTHLTAITSLLSRLTVRFASEPTPGGTVVEIDHAALAPDDVGRALPLDPGTHDVTVTASGYVPWAAKIDLGAVTDEQTITVPALEPLPAPAFATPPPAAAAQLPQPPPAPATAPAPPQPLPPRPEPSRSLRTAGYVTGGAGLAALGVGTYFGVSALVLKGRSDRVCSGDVCSAQSGVDDFDKAKSQAVVADVAIATGLVAVGVGAYLVIRSRSQEQPPNVVGVSVEGTRGGGLASCTGTF